MLKNVVPQALLESLRDVRGFDEDDFITVHNNASQVVSIRINPAKMQVPADLIFPGSMPVPWTQFGYYLPSRPSFTLDPLLHAGAYYVQEASSMFLEQCFVQHVPASPAIRVLDLCAAPGGKSTHIQSLISPGSLLVSNEVIKSRVNVLVENLSKWGAANVIATNNDPADFTRLPGFFDVIVIDAPCSGSGLFRRDPSATQEWSVEAVHLCSLRQQRILTHAYDALKKGGLLIYSTCSYSPQENEDICDWLCDQHDLSPLPLLLNAEWQIVETASRKHKVPGYRFYPYRVAGEGFFMACFRKNEGDEDGGQNRKRKLTPIARANKPVAEKWLEEPGSLSIFESEPGLFCFPQSLEDALASVHANLYVKKAGVQIGKVINGELVPDHELAISSIVKKNLPFVSLKREDALQYLRKEEVTVEPGRKGWALVKYDQWNLGWMKLLGNRANNYYPREWRILKSGNN